MFIINEVKVVNVWLSETNKSDLQDKIIECYDYSTECEFMNEYIVQTIKDFFKYRGFTVKEMLDYLTCTGQILDITLDEIEVLQDKMVDEVIRYLEIDANISMF